MKIIKALYAFLAFIITIICVIITYPIFFTWNILYGIFDGLRDCFAIGTYYDFCETVGDIIGRFRIKAFGLLHKSDLNR